MRRVLLVMAVVLAGCTSLPAGGGSDDPKQSGLLIQQASADQSTIPENGETTLTLRLANTGSDPVEEVDIVITNQGGLAVSREQGDSALCNPSPGSSAVTIGASAQGTPRKRVCVWSVEASPGSVDPGTYPLTVSVRYENTLRMQQQSLKFEFDPDQQAPSPAVTRSFSNGEVSMRTRHPPRLPLNPSRVAVELTGQNVGSGELGNLGSGLPAECSSSEVRCMRLRYDGSLTNAFTQDGSGRCGRVVVRPGRRSGETQCTFTGSVSGPVTHNLRISADYRYQRRRVVPVTVAETS